MAERVRWLTDHVLAVCAINNPGCDYVERAESPGPDEQKVLLRHAREHARKTGHRVSIDRVQMAVIEP